MSDLDDFKATYFEECSELLADLEEQFAALAAGERSRERLNAAFRAIHSIKGGAGAFGFSTLVGFAHAYETLLDRVRDGRVELSAPVIALCIRANDIVADHIAAARNEADLGGDHGEEEKAQFNALASGEVIVEDGGPPIEEFDIDFVPVMVRLDDQPIFEEDSFTAPTLNLPRGTWEIRFTPHAALYARANDPLLLLRELATLGETSVSAVLRDLPPLADFEPFGVYCSWEITLVSPTATEAEIREVFEFVEGNCDLSITELAALRPSTTRIDLDLDRIPSFSELAAELGAYSAAALEEESAVPSLARRAAELLPAPPQPEAPTGAASLLAPRAAPLPSETPPAEAVGDRRNGIQSIRVDLDKVDRVVNMVSELVITQSMLTQQMDDNLRTRYQELVRGLEVLAQTTRGLQDSVMSIRAQPVKSVFSRMPRLVRELAQQTGKKIRLETVGENTEIDKTVIEQLSDPLTHMIRNSADHGIETAELRLGAGKPETGTIRLSAEHAGGNILIIVEDDGAGIDRERVLQVARGRGVVGPEQQLSDEQVDQLIFAPGFSTVGAVSEISGRGVGMDVVLSNIKKIGGAVQVRSWPGKGTRLTLRLPLTLAILEVMLVKVAQCPYVIPLSSIIETIQHARADFSRAPSGAQLLRVRGEYVQVIDLAARFELGTAAAGERFVVLCEAEGALKVALVVDDIVGQQQVVIKSLEENFEPIDGIAGGTILGDGNVALIIDVQGLQASTGRRQAA